MFKILIVDDNPAVRESFTDLLVSEGYQALCAATGEEGLRKIAQHEPDLLVLDMTMPGMDGRSVLLHLKRVSKDLPVIVMTGKKGMKEDPEIRLSPQVFRFFTKPADPKQFLEAVKSVFRMAAQEFTWRQKHLGGCRIVRCLGRGASGRVYEATRGGEKVAIKILSDMNEEKIARARREARGLATLQHPNILRFFDVGYTDDGVYFLITELFPGQSLDKLLEAEAFDVPETVGIGRQVAQALAVAHAHGIVHRDIKPGNILYDREKRMAKVIDFGIARETASQQAITAQGVAVGSPAYMSPEQCRGEEIDGRSDIYSLGITLYHLVTGFLPFSGARIAQVIYDHLFTPVTWPEGHSEHVPPELKAILEKMLAKAPEDRYADMGEVDRDLEFFLSL